MKSKLQEKWVFILLGDNDTGKTTFQKLLIEILFRHWYLKLPSNQSYPIKNSSFRNLETIFIMGRSFQEKYNDSEIDNFFANDFEKSDICILSSHMNDVKRNCNGIITRMINKSHEKKYNVCAVFFSNAKYGNKGVFQLPWDKRINLINRRKTTKEEIKIELKGLAEEFSGMLLKEYDR